MQIVFSGFMLGQRMWTSVTRILGIVVDIAGMILAIVLLRTPGVFNFTSEVWSAIGDAEAAETLSRIFTYLPALIITIVVIATTVSVIKSLLRLFHNQSPYPAIKVVET